MGVQKLPVLSGFAEPRPPPGRPPPLQPRLFQEVSVLRPEAPRRAGPSPARPPGGLRGEAGGDESRKMLAGDILM